LEDLQIAMEKGLAQIWDAIQSAKLDDIPTIAAYLIAQTSMTVGKKGVIHMMILCIKPVVMRLSQRTVFTEGTTYEAVVTGNGIEAKNDDNVSHQLFNVGADKDDWDWFVKYFA